MDNRFETFWELYGKKRERSDASRAWQRLTDDEQQAAIRGIAAYHRQCQKDGRTLPYPAAYLNQHLWQRSKGRPPKTARRPATIPPDPETW